MTNISVANSKHDHRLNLMRLLNLTGDNASTEPQGTHRQTPRQHQKARRGMQEIHLNRDGVSGGIKKRIQGVFIMYGWQTNLQVLSFNSSCLDWQSKCVNLQEHLQVRGSCTNKRFLLSEQGAQWLQGKQKGRDRERSKLQSEFCRKSRHRHSCNTPPNQPLTEKRFVKTKCAFVYTQDRVCGWDVKLQYNIRLTHQLLQSSCPLTPV